MDAFTPSSPIVLVAVVLAAMAALAIGYFLQRSRAGRTHLVAAWMLAVVLVAAGHLGLRTEGAGFRMVALLLLLCHGMKAVVAVESRRAGMPALGAGRWLAFAALWFGMQPREFALAESTRDRPGRPRRSPRRPTPAQLVRSGLGWIAAGTLVFAIAVRLFHGEANLRIAGLLFVAGFSMWVHFGLIQLLAALHRSFGFATGPQFHAPWRATSLHEFWARRWNAAFAVMTTLVVYRPTAGRIGRGGALLGGFLASGVFHEVACSLPVTAGFGGPTAYFALHGIAVLVERRLERIGRGLRGVAARAWVFAWVLVPLPLLFHLPFLRGVVLPWLEAPE